MLSLEFISELLLELKTEFEYLVKVFIDLLNVHSVEFNPQLDKFLNQPTNLVSLLISDLCIIPVKLLQLKNC